MLSGCLSWQDQGLTVEGTNEVALFPSEGATWLMPSSVVTGSKD